MENKGQFRQPEQSEIDVKRAEALKVVSDTYPSKLGHFKRAYGGSLRSAITAKCLECCSGCSATIRLCTSYACPLWGQRPFKEVRK